LKLGVETCNRSWPHDWVEVWQRCSVALDFNNDDFVCTFFLVHKDWGLSVEEVFFWWI